jgi:hypothetical protein
MNKILKSAAFYIITGLYQAAKIQRVCGLIAVRFRTAGRLKHPYAE